MTMVVGFNLGYYALVLADTRVTYLSRRGPSTFQDGRKKVRLTRMGLVSGAGFTSLLDTVDARLAVEDIYNTNAFVEIADAARETEHRRWEGDERMLDGIRHTTW